MDIRLNKAEFRTQVENIRRTKRVRKPNKDEEDQNQHTFKDQFEQVSKDDESAGDQKENRGNKEQPEKQKPQQPTESDPDQEAEQLLGKHIDLKA